jgi:hypothetical protein
MGVESRLTILDVFHSLLEEGDDVLVLHPVIDFLAIATELDQAHLAQPAQVMRDGTLADTNRSRQCADVHLTDHQRRENPHPTGVTKGAEEFCHMGGGVLVEGSEFVIHNI